MSHLSPPPPVGNVASSPAPAPAWHSIEIPVFGGRESHIKTGEPYQTMRLADLFTMPPAALPKIDAQAFIPSTYCEHDARVHAVQQAHGQFVALTADIDEGDHPLETVEAGIREFAGDAACLVHSSASSRPGHRKWRIIIPLAAPVDFQTWHIAQKLFHDHLAAAGIKPDGALVRAGQIIFAPNVPAVHEGTGTPLREGGVAEGAPLYFERLHSDMDAGVLDLCASWLTLEIMVAREAVEAEEAKAKRCEVGAIAPGAEIDSKVALALAREAAAAWPPSVEGKGGRTNMLALVMQAGDLGVSPDACLDVLLVAGGWNERCAPPWEHEELDYQVRSVFASRSMPIGCNQPAVIFAGVSVDPPEVSAPPGVRGPTRRWFDSGDAYDVDEMSWLVDGMLPARGVGIIGGPSQSGKTFLVYALAQCLATGEPFFGHKADELVSTFILQSESYLSGRKRLHAIDRQRGSAEPLPISILDAGGIASHAEQRAIIEMIVAKRDGFVLRGFPRLGLVVLDTLSASRLIAKENGNDEIADGIRFLQTLADQFQCLVLVTHHPTKDADSGLRGGGALTANVDLVMEVQRKGKAAVREVECVKQRDGEQRLWGHFTLPVIEVGKRRNGKVETTCYVSMSEGAAPAATKPLDEHERAALNVLREMYAEDQRMGANTFMEVWKRLCAENNGVSSAEQLASRQKAASRAVKGLLDKGCVSVSGSGRDQIVRPVDPVILPPVFDGGHGQQ